MKARLVGSDIYRRHAVLTKGVNRFGSEGEGGEGRGLATLLTAQTAVWLVGLLALLAARLVSFLPSSYIRLVSRKVLLLCL